MKSFARKLIALSLALILLSACVFAIAERLELPAELNVIEKEAAIHDESGGNAVGSKASDEENRRRKRNGSDEAAHS